MTTTLTSPTSKKSGSPTAAAFRPSAGARRRGAGFTLVELVIVVTILALVFLAAAPAAVGMMRSSRERAALRQVVALLKHARTRAVASGRLVRVVCDPREGTLWAEAQVDPRGDRSEFEHLRFLGRPLVRLPQGLALADLVIAGRHGLDSWSQVYFYPDGHTDGALIFLERANGQEVVILLAPATGRVSIGA